MFPSVPTTDFTWSAAHTAPLLQHRALLGSLRDVEPLSRLHLPEGLPRGILEQDFLTDFRICPPVPEGCDWSPLSSSFFTYT